MRIYRYTISDYALARQADGIPKPAMSLFGLSAPERTIPSGNRRVNGTHIGE